jgi:hypothetical protein
MSEAVTAGTQSFLTSRILRGGSGHWSDSRSLSFDSGESNKVNVYERLFQDFLIKDSNAHLDNWVGLCLVTSGHL